MGGPYNPQCGFGLFCHMENIEAINCAQVRNTPQMAFNSVSQCIDVVQTI